MEVEVEEEVEGEGRDSEGEEVFMDHDDIPGNAFEVAVSDEEEDDHDVGNHQEEEAFPPKSVLSKARW